MSERLPRITPELLARERERVGRPIGRLQPHVETATKDAIRHWARGIGDGCDLDPLRGVPDILRPCCRARRPIGQHEPAMHRAHIAQLLDQGFEETFGGEVAGDVLGGQ